MELIDRNEPTWHIQDATKIQNFMDCPRQYFYQYILGWQSEIPSVHLEFGTAWHLAQEHLLLHGYGQDSIQEAWEKCKNQYRMFFPPEMDEPNHPKNPGMALLGLLGYAEKYKDDNHTTLYTEIAGTVSLDENRFLHFRQDSILETPVGIKSREHKTGSQLSRVWSDQWKLKFQTGVYNHVLYCLFPPEKVWGVEINGSIFSKKEVKHERVPVRRTPKMMQEWYWNAIHWYNMITWEFERLAECKEGDGVLMCFPQNTENCTKYFGCPYFDFCSAWANPLQYIAEPPQGFVVKHWNPAEAEAKHKFNI